MDTFTFHYAQLTCHARAPMTSFICMELGIAVGGRVSLSVSVSTYIHGRWGPTPNAFSLNLRRALNTPATQAVSGCQCYPSAFALNYAIGFGVVGQFA